MKAVCTIINKKYIPFAIVMQRSIARFMPDLQFRVAVTDGDVEIDTPTGMRFFNVAEITSTPLAKKIFSKYAHTNEDHLRWALKPVVLLHLLNEFENVIFIDPDNYFIGDPAFLFEELSAHDVLLSPHWSETDPLVYEDGLFSVMRNGLYCGCFVGANQRSKNALHWWAEVCHYKMEKRKDLGVYDDQKYLDLFPLLLNHAGIIRHPGCNLTNINLSTCKRSMENGKLKINGSYDPVFIHFTKDTIYNIDKGNDPLLQPYLSAYRKELSEAGYELTVTADKFYEPLKRKFLLRTRLKKLFFRMAEKI